MRMMRRPSRDRDESGAVAVIVALMLVALLGMAVLTVDVGGMMVSRRKMVNAADAAAIAAAQWCAELGGSHAVSPSAESHADGVAQLNVAGASRIRFEFMPGSICPGPYGAVKVEYETTQNLIFASVLGLENTTPVRAQATGVWGAAGIIANGVVPIMVNADHTQGDCGIPDGTPGTECSYWYNNRELGNAQWGWLDLSNWDVDPAFHCPNAGAAARTEWISYGYAFPLPLNFPDPTYVCTTNGASESVWKTLETRVGDELVFPVNDPATQIMPPPETPTKYNIIGFVTLRVTDIIKGNDPLAIGTSTQTGNCSKAVNLSPTAPELYLDGLGCYPSVPNSITNLNLVGEKKSGGVTETIPLTEGVDYTYDPTIRKVTWLRSDTLKVNVTFAWQIDGTSGKCEPPERTSDPNAKCIVTEWVGFTTTYAAEPGGGADLGIRATRLAG